MRQRVNAGIAVKVAHGRYNAIATAKNERAHQGDRRRGVVNLSSARLKKAQAEKVEQENTLRRGELIPRNDVQALFAATMAIVARMCSALDRRIPPLVVGQDDHRKVGLAIRGEVNAVRQAAAKELTALAGGEPR